jgi:P27 family predicted phage terminase small subunit
LNKKPRHLRLIQGTLRPDRASGETPKPRPVAPKPPKGLSPHGRAFWRSVAPVLQRLGLLTELDGMAFQVLCETHARGEYARRRLRMLERRLRQATTLEQLALIRKAEVSVERAEHAFRQLAAEFGLTPAARSRLDVYAPTGGVSDEDEEQAFLDKYLHPRSE